MKIEIEIQEEALKACFLGAEGAIPSGTRITKINSDLGDRVLDGAKGVVEGSMIIAGRSDEGLPPPSSKCTRYAYLVHWDFDLLKNLTFVVDGKIQADI